MAKRKGDWCPKHPSMPLIRLERGAVPHCATCTPSRRKARILPAHRRVLEGIDTLMVEIAPHVALNAEVAVSFAIVTREEVTIAEKISDHARAA